MSSPRKDHTLSEETTDSNRAGSTRKTVLTKETLVPVSALCAICWIVWAAADKWNSTQEQTSRSLLLIDQRLGTIEAKLLDRWTGTDMENWTLRLQIENPTVKVPASKH